MEVMPLPLDPPVEKTTKPRRNSADKEALDLVFHGTKAFEMTPAMVIQAAEQDIRNHAHNLRVKAERKREKSSPRGRPDLVDPTRPLAFLPRHVRGCTTAAQVITNALAELAHGAGNKDPNTARLYNTPDVLRAALSSDVNT